MEHQSKKHFIISGIFWIMILFVVVAFAGCQAKPLEVIPTLGAYAGADKIDCHYKRDGKKYSTDCTIHDEGTIK